MPDTLLESILYDLIVTFVSAAFAYLVGRVVYEKVWKSWRYGDWRVRVLKADGTEGTDRPLSAATAERILKDPNEMSVFIKGVSSFYGWLSEDPVGVAGRRAGLLSENHVERIITLDLSKNLPEPVPPNASPEREST